MPRIPTYQPNQVGLVQTTEARFRAPDIAPSGLARGMQGLGQALGEYANAQDQLIATSEDTQARTMALDARSQVNGVLTQYGTLEGGNAVNAQGSTLEQIKAIRDKAAAGLGSPRMKRFFDQHFGESYADALDRVNGHAVKQVQVQRKGALEAEAQDFADQAITEWQDPELRGKAIAMGGMALSELGRMQGLDDSAIALNQKKYLSGIHRNTIDRMLAAANPDPEAAMAYYEAHASDMVSADSESVLKDLQGPMQFREDYSSFTRALSTGADEKGVPTQQDGKGWTKVATDVARKFRLSPTEVAAVMSYETAGTFSPTIMGGKNGQYMGLIQFGPSERAKYGIDKNSTPEQWANAISGFLSDRGFKPGMGVKDLYSTINAGAPGRYAASDGNGTVESHVDKILREHMPVADKWLAGGGVVPTEMPRRWDKDQTYNRIDALADREGWSLEKRERVKGIADKQIARDENLLDRQFKSAGQEAVQVIGQLGDNFTDISQIPRSVRDKADPNDVLTWTETARKNREERAKIPEKGPRANELDILSRVDKEGFLKVDLSKEVGKVSPDELLRFSQKQADILGEKNKPPQPYDSRGLIVEAINWSKKYGQIDVPDADFPKVFDTMDAILKGIYEKKGVVTRADADSVLLAAVREHTNTGGWLWNGSTKLYEVSRVDQIPEQTMGNINRSLKQVLKREPTDKERLVMYRRLLAGM